MARRRRVTKEEKAKGYDFEEMMQRSKPIDEYGCYFTTEERDFMGKHDLVRFAKKFPLDAEAYMAEDY